MYFKARWSFFCVSSAVLWIRIRRIGIVLVDPIVAEPELRAEEPKINCLRLPEPNYELRLRLLSVYHRLEETLKKKILVAEEVFVNCYNFNPTI
jgi:hypothetical protein